MKTVAINGRWSLSLPDHRAAWLNALQSWEAVKLDSMCAHLQPDDLVLDCGAEVGDQTALMASWGCRVVAIEPSVHYWPSIRRTFEANGLQIAGCFVGFASDVDEFTPAFLAHEDPYPTREWPKCSEGPIDKRDGFAHLAQQSAEFPQCTLDSLARRFGVPDAITMDCEGSDYRVLLGSVGILSEYKPLLWISVHQDREWMRTQYPDQGIDTITGLLDSYGYQGIKLDSSHEDHHFFWHPDRLASQ